MNVANDLRRLGAWKEKGGIRFRLWAPKANSVEVMWLGTADKPEKSFLQMQQTERGYHEFLYPQGQEGGRYKFRLNGGPDLPDPASRFQPEGPHGPSEVVPEIFDWKDSSWKGLSLSEMVIYELHVGTFSEEGTFAGIEKHLAHLRETGFNAIEIMPIAQFAGGRNWGYDGVGLFAAQNTYGDQQISPLALKHLINACHQQGIAVFLDVVYNHLGPEGNYLPQMGPYFQNKYKTPWGEALNYDGEWSDEVRNYFLQSARQWMEEFHFDGLRLDAIHAIFDTSAKPFLEELADLAREIEKKSGRKIHLIAESETNDSRILQPPTEGGLGLDGQWADDLHHVVHSLVTGEKEGYYADYGKIEQLARAYQDGVVFHGEYSPYRHRSHGRSYEGIAHSRLVVCSQNHDQIGNRRDGERLITLVGAQKAKLAAACILLSPALPLIFMGEELGEESPFLYFVDHTDKNLLEAVRKGRKEEFSAFAWQGEAPDPASLETFKRSKVNWSKAESPQAQIFKNYYRRLIALSKWIRKEGLLEKGLVRANITHDGQIVDIMGKKGDALLQIFFSFSANTLQLNPDVQGAELEIILDSSEDRTFESRKPLGKSGVEIKPFTALVLSNHREVSN